MPTIFYLGITDYVVIIIMLLVSTAIGYKFRLTTAKCTIKEYVMAGRDMSMLPVIMSITATMISAISLIGSPAETYRYGLQGILMPLAMPIGMALASYILIPVYFQCGISTVYEFLEMRFGKTTRYVLSSFFILQMILYMSSALYAPVLAINAVTHLSIEFSTILFGSICAVYCAVGGLKGVLWTDVFQSLLMFFTIFAIYISGIIDMGGLSDIFSKAYEGGRLGIFNFSVDFTERYTVWNTILHGIVFGFGCYGTTQVEVQRLLSLSSCERAKRSLLISSVPVALIYALCTLYGLVLYGLYYSCDPVKNIENTGVAKYDQLVPYYLVSKFTSIPGLTGFCVAGIFSGSLSTISSALNSLAAVTVIDFIYPFYPNQLSETKSVFIAKGLSLFYGLLCIVFSFALMQTDSLMQVGALFNGIVEAPSAAVFLVGVLSRKGSNKSVLSGFVVGFVITTWIAYGSLFGGYISPTLSLKTDTCTEHGNLTYLLANMTSMQSGLMPSSTDFVPQGDDAFVLYKIAFMWMRPLGLVITLICISIAVLLTSWNKEGIPANSRCLSPITRYWIKNTEANDLNACSMDDKSPTQGNFSTPNDDKTYI